MYVNFLLSLSLSLASIICTISDSGSLTRIPLFGGGGAQPPVGEFHILTKYQVFWGVLILKHYFISVFDAQQCTPLPL